MAARRLKAARAQGELLMGGSMQLRMAATEEGKPPRFDLVAYTGGTIRPDSPYLEAPMVIELAGVSSPDRIAALLDHRDDLIIGQTDQVRIGRSEITMSGIITGDVTADEETNPGAKVVKHAGRGFIWPVSLGGSIEQLDYIQPGVATTVNGQRLEGPLYIARRVRLNHIAFLSVPADQAATARIAARSAKEATVNFHDWLKKMGFEDPSTLTAAQRTSLEAKFKEEERLSAGNTPPSNPPAPAPAPAKKPRTKSKGDELEVIKARNQRRDQIHEIAARIAREYPDAVDDISARRDEAIEDEELTAADFENLLLRECTRYERIDNRPRSQRESAAVTSQMLEVALCGMGGTTEEVLVKQYGAQTLEMSRRRFRHGLSIREFLEMAADANGFHGSLRSDPMDVLAAAIPDVRTRHARRELAAAGPSTYDVSGVLGNVLNRFIVDHFNAVDQEAMRRITAIRPVSDFRQIQNYALTGDMRFEKVAPGGELKHATLGSQGYTNQADTYGKLISIDRRDLINDDLGAFTRIGQRLGRGGALALLHAFWTEFLDNATFFVDTNSNFDDGADTALSIVALTLAKTLFRKQVDPDNQPMRSRPRILLVPPELDDTGKTILTSQLVVMAGTEDPSVVRGNANIHAGTLDLASASELSNSTYTGHSAKKWYVLADPNDVPVIETCFLNNVQRPTVENAQADFNILGISFRGYFDFGVRKQEFRGGVAMKGEV